MTWDLNQLETLLNQHEDLVVTHQENVLLIANSEGLDAWLAISGEQILVESILFNTNEVKDTAAFNEEVLRTHMLFPLTTIGISSIADEDYYVAFGALSSQSKESSIMIEVETLFQNVEAFLDAYQEHLN
jgi:uncharacterized protein YjfI (DUF2170 family)